MKAWQPLRDGRYIEGGIRCPDNDDEHYFTVYRDGSELSVRDDMRYAETSLNDTTRLCHAVEVPDPVQPPNDGMVETMREALELMRSEIESILNGFRFTKGIIQSDTLLRREMDAHHDMRRVSTALTWLEQFGGNDEDTDG